MKQSRGSPRTIAIAIAMLAFAALAAPALAQRYPSKPIRFLIPPPPGGLLFYAIVAPAKTPRAIVDKLNAAVKEIKRSPTVKQQLAALGAEPVEMTPDALGKFLERELVKWTKVIQTGGIKAD